MAAIRLNNIQNSLKIILLSLFTFLTACNPTVELVISPNPPSVGDPVTFDASNSAAAGSKEGYNAIKSFEWKFGDGNSSNGKEVTHIYDNKGDYVVELTVTDNRGRTHTVNKTITVNAVKLGNPVAKFSLSTNSLRADEPLTLDASDSVADKEKYGNKLTKYEWKLGDGSVATGKVIEHKYNKKGKYVVELTVTDTKNNSSKIQKTINVDAAIPSAPTAKYTFTPNPGVEGKPVKFDASQSIADKADDGNTLTQYDWRFGDGSTASGKTVEHTYATKGNYPISLTVTDSSGQTHTLNKTLHVASAESIIANPTNYTWENISTVGDAIGFHDDSYSQTMDVNDNGTAVYAWHDRHTFNDANKTYDTLYASIRINGQWLPAQQLTNYEANEALIRNIHAVTLADDTVVVVWRKGNSITFKNEAEHGVYAKVYRNNIWSDAQLIDKSIISASTKDTIRVDDIKMVSFSNRNKAMVIYERRVHDPKTVLDTAKCTSTIQNLENCPTKVIYQINTQVYSSTFDGTGWSDPQSSETNARLNDFAYNSELNTDQSSKPIIAWSGKYDGVSGVWGQTYDVTDKTWSTPMQIQADEQEVLVLDALDSKHVVFTGGTTNKSIWLYSHDSEPEKILDIPYEEYNYSKNLRMQSDGNKLVITYVNRKKQGMFKVYNHDIQQWFDTIGFDPDGYQMNGFDDFVLTPSGKWLVTYMAYSKDNNMRNSNFITELDVANNRVMQHSKSPRAFLKVAQLAASDNHLFFGGMLHTLDGYIPKVSILLDD